MAALPSPPVEAGEAGAGRARLTELLPQDLGPLERAGLGALLAALLLAPILGGAPSGAVYGQDVGLNLLRALVLLGALCFVMASPAPTMARASTVAVWLLAGLTLLSLLWHSRVLTIPVLLFAMLPAALDWLCLALGFTLALHLGRRPETRILLAGALIAGAVWVALAGAREYGAQAQVGNRGWRVMATFFTPNFTAGFLALCLPITTGMYLQARSPVGVFGLGAAAALVSGVLVATGSRLGIAAAGAGLALALGLALLGRVRLPGRRLGALLAALVVMGVGFRGPLTSRIAGNPGGQSHSREFRAWTWKGTWRMARANPLLGTGPGTFEFRYPPYAFVAKTSLAHSSYAQLAAEQGFPALIAAMAALAAALLAGLRGSLRRARTGDRQESGSHRLLLCSLCGGLAAGLIRNGFDSEWSVLGTALPFWVVAGLTAGAGSPEAAMRAAAPQPRLTPAKAPVLCALLAALSAIALLFYQAVTLQGARATVREDPIGAAGRAERAAAIWPPDPTAITLHAQLDGSERVVEAYERAARIEPSGRRWYQLAPLYERVGLAENAVRALERARRADPNHLQTLRALAEARARLGDRSGALAVWREMVRLHEGRVGQVRALPELADTYPAWAYAALARDTRSRGDAAHAAALYAKTAAVIEDYADTAPIYQAVEQGLAQQSGGSLDRRRRELRALYEQVMAARIQRAEQENDPGTAAALAEQRAGTLARLAEFLSAGAAE